MFWLNPNFNHLDFPYIVPREDIVHQLCIPIAAIIYRQIFDILKISWYLQIRSNSKILNPWNPGISYDPHFRIFSDPFTSTFQQESSTIHYAVPYPRTTPRKFG